MGDERQVRFVPVSELKMGDAIGSPRRTLYVLVADPVVTAAGTVKAQICFEDSRVEHREWLHGSYEVAVRA